MHTLMQNRSIGLLGVLGLCLLPAALGGAAPEPKVDICHVPPGNPANAHFISVSGNALDAHLAHGDPAPGTTDTCPPTPPTDPTCVPDPEGEICGDNLDNNCDGEADENCPTDPGPS